MPRDLFKLDFDVRMSADKGDTAEVRLYGTIINDMPENWKFSKEDKSAAEFDKAIKDVRASGAKKLLLRINSPGGVVSQAVAMRAILNAAGFEEITIRIDGICASAATLISTIPGAHVAIVEGGMIMIHNPIGGAFGNARDMENYAQYLRGIEDTSREMYAKRSGQSDEQIREWMDNETWFVAKSAVENGFADEVLEAEAQDELPAVACVTSAAMDLMRRIYKTIPEQVAVETPQEQNVSNAAPVGAALESSIRPSAFSGIAGKSETQSVSDLAGEASEIHHEEDHNGMEIKDINMDQLRSENPALLEQIQQDALAMERQRIEDIDALTLPGCEEMAEEAKKKGTSVMEFQKQIVQAQKQKGKAYLDARQRETEPAKNVAGQSAEENDGADSDEEQIKALQAEVKGYAAAMKSTNETMY